MKKLDPTGKEVNAFMEAMGHPSRFQTGDDIRNILGLVIQAALARVDALTKERDFEQSSRLTSESQMGVEIDRLIRERDAAIKERNQWCIDYNALTTRFDDLTDKLAASGAVAEAMRVKIEALRTDPSSSIMQDAYWAKTWDACIDRVLELIPTDAAAALAEHDKRVREKERAEIVAILDHCCGDEGLQPATGWTDTFIAAWNTGGLDHLFAAKAAILVRKEG
ncbi:hypothetical protein RM190_04755 [Paracoccus sp. CPCC 101403]|uniref:Ead/Ea22-like family protein n=1 Tax=Paracoccus broussonetiae TaxID=3075834 RepID=A0ABU3EAA9_9RHOB|nr:hypothetical protein [Paracoccus sp. CPCC 101403]MDT1061158.1 hypothetical protein [Paracoccus sp. CPCC 101403]